MRIIHLLSIIIFCISISACTGNSTVADNNVHILLHTKNSAEPIQILVEIADTPLKQADGLMNRTNLPTNTGMLFTFPNEADRTFWMKDTLIPLDILYFDAKQTLVSMYSMTPCLQDPCTRYPSMYPIMYALEVPAGFIQQHSIQVGDTFTNQ